MTKPKQPKQGAEWRSESGLTRLIPGEINGATDGKTVVCARCEQPRAFGRPCPRCERVGVEAI